MKQLFLSDAVGWILMALALLSLPGCLWSIWNDERRMRRLERRVRSAAP